MAFAPDETFKSEAGIETLVQGTPTCVQVKSFPANFYDSGVALPRLFPISWSDEVWEDESGNVTAAGFRPWENPSSQAWTVNITATGGTFVLEVNSVETVAIAFNASAATVLAALVTLVGANQLTVTKSESIYTISTINQLGNTTSDLLIYKQNLTGPSTNGVVTETSTFSGVLPPDGFLWQDSITLSATAVVLGAVMLGGRVLAADLEEAYLLGRPTGNVFHIRSALQDRTLLNAFIVEGLIPPTY